jgi:hypothetical protein
VTRSGEKGARESHVLEARPRRPIKRAIAMRRWKSGHDDGVRIAEKDHRGNRKRATICGDSTLKSSQSFHAQQKTF